MSKKLSKEEKKQREVYRANVISALEGFRRAPVGGSEKRYLARKDFLPNKLRHEVVEVLCDYIQSRGVGVNDLFLTMEQENAQARALWYTYSTFDPVVGKKKKDSKVGEEKFDPHGPGKSVFEVDVRYLAPNIHVVCEALQIYLRESGEAVFSHASFESFLVSWSAKDANEAQKLAALSSLMKG